MFNDGNGSNGSSKLSLAQLNQRHNAGKASAAKRTHAELVEQAAVMRAARAARDQVVVDRVRAAGESFRTGGIFKAKAVPPMGPTSKPINAMPPQDELNDKYIMGAALGIGYGAPPWVKPTKEQLAEVKNRREGSIIWRSEDSYDIVDGDDTMGPTYSREWFDAQK